MKSSTIAKAAYCWSNPCSKSFLRLAGIEISEHTLQVQLYPRGASRRFANDLAGLKAFTGWLREFVVAHIVFEPTGAYHRNVERQLAAAGFALVKVNPRQARRFAEVIGRQAKTDAVDAAMLARFGALIDPPPRETMRHMMELHVGRRALVKDRVAALNWAQTLQSPLPKRQAAERVKQIQRQIHAIDTALRHLLEADPLLKARFGILRSIPGLGEITACPVDRMPELSRLDNNCAATPAGLAPIARDSGQHRGKRCIRGGRATVRQMLYIPALVAVRFNADLKAKYAALIAAGKPAEVAITANMRKLLILANTLLRDRAAGAPGCPRRSFSHAANQSSGNR